jgi:hypothetical protein
MIIFIFSISFVKSNRPRCEIDEIDFANFDENEYLKTCNWFDLKNNFYMQSNLDPESTISGLMANALERLNVHRKSSIKKGMKYAFAFTPNLCEEIDGVPEKFEGEFAKLGLRGSEEVWYFDCSEYYYIVTSFGSSTLTSDFDFSVYRIRNDDEFVTARDEIESIKQITSMLGTLSEYIKNFVCHGESMQKCFDSNGYPEIMVFYNQYFLDLKLDTDHDIKEARFANIVSSKIIRFCVVAQIYTAKIIKHFEDEHFIRGFEKFFRRCYRKMEDSTRLLFTLNNISFEINSSEIIMDRNFGSRAVRRRKDIGRIKGHYAKHKRGFTNHQYAIELIKDDFGENLMTYNEPNHQEREEYIANTYRILRFFLEEPRNPTVKFNKCINNIQNPIYFMEKLYITPADELIRKYRETDSQNLRVFQHLNKDYLVYDELFYVPSSDQITEGQMVNRMLLPFLGACHIWADEAYVTFGALEFVKREKQILDEENPILLRCDSYVETYFENMGMMLFHIYEEATEKTIMSRMANEFQSISDAYSKYLRRAMIALKMPCLNDFGKEVDRFILINKENKKDFDKIKNHVINQFFNKIRYITSGDKKKRFFHFFKEIIGRNRTIKTVLTEALEFHRILSSKIIYAYADIDLYTKPEASATDEHILVE